MSPSQMPNRRTVLRVFGVGVVGALAGCVQSSEPGATDGDPTETTTIETSTTAATTASESTTADSEETQSTTTNSTPTDESGGQTSTDESDGVETSADGTDESDGETLTAENDGELDLREANVVAVAVEGQTEGYRFDVTLIHDDDGEDGYADWWQVETVDGEQLGRRELLHAHGTQEFTRSETIEISDEFTCVVVRGHDQTHGYGGQAMLVNIETGSTKTVQQGREKRSMSAESCPSEYA